MAHLHKNGLFSKKWPIFQKCPIFTGPNLKRARHTGLSARMARKTKSRGPKGLQLEVGARRAPRLLVCHIANLCILINTRLWYKFGHVTRQLYRFYLTFVKGANENTLAYWSLICYIIFTNWHSWRKYLISMISTKCETDDIFSVHRIPIVQCHLSIEQVKLTAKNSNLIVTAKVYLSAAVMW